ncbi:hypothetical protein LSG25_07060 [Paralcaligenes sp. KSB-10]|uniref:hypothetical protein n=1 Tax=Paralcaligenes sp. KSB-10 TaxID=2901142 RepID=UPI001E5912F3|nr:hypothetical protein [Paralcaligenes sp. KSB-10]UHL65626.1 hypothetical protein LSG25_07060 [Paralcaligenes sp. KSB-10]
MTKQSRIALALSTSALCLGIAMAPSAFAASATHAKTTHHAKHKAKSATAKTAAPGAMKTAPAAKTQK